MWLWTGGNRLCTCYLNKLSLYEEERERWRGGCRMGMVHMNECELIRGYHVRSDEIEKGNNEIYESDVEQ